jgi:SAM-dependent methyltransferase
MNPRSSPDPAPADQQIEPGTLCFQCNLCGETSMIHVSKLTREDKSCPSCRSNARRRALIRVLLAELGIEQRVLAHVAPTKEIIGLGMTDSNDYAKMLADKFTYKNTFLHEEPMLDIGASHLPKELKDRHDFVICSEVLEHVTPPVDRAFKNIFQILKYGGILVLTVPYGLQETTLEHFPDLNEFSITEQYGSYTLRNVTKDGVVQEFRNLVFHGGPGMTLEMRVFSEKDLVTRLENSGFRDVKVHRHPDLTCAAWWPQPWSLPISAHKPSRIIS